MFFRREKAPEITFNNRLDKLRQNGFEVRSGSDGTEVRKHGCSATVKDLGAEVPTVSKAGVVIGKEIGFLVHGGYQQFFITPSGRKFPALAQQLRALHDFQEDLKEGLGIESLYNTSLGTIADRHMYDRVEERDSGGHKDFSSPAKWS